MAGVAVEDALELWAASLREVRRRIRPRFTRERVAVSAGPFPDGLLGRGRKPPAIPPLAAAGRPRPRPLGGGRPARPRARGLGRQRGGPGPRRVRLPRAGRSLL